MLYKIYLGGLLMLFASVLTAQPPCTFRGQTPATALTICGNTTYSQSPLSPCFNNSFFVPGCTNENTNYGDNNPIYYKFTCKSSGTFGFVVMPWKPTDDYNWQLFDITGKTPNDIFTNKTLSVAGNWSGTVGPTGASPAGVNFIQCRSFPVFGEKNTFSSMPLLTAGHTYLLLVGSLDASGAFALTVGGGTADITDNINQAINTSVSSCNNNEVVLSFTKKISCYSIAADGSDFSITPATAAIISAEGINCSTSSETDSIRIRFANPLPDGNYALFIKNGTDNNTISDACRNVIAAGTELKLTIFPYAFIDTVITSCKPNELTIKLTKDVLCSSVARNGSDFNITGPAPAIITAANFNCLNGTTNTITLVLQQKIITGGNYNVTITRGADGNSLISTCNTATPAGTLHTLTLKDIVTANFTHVIKEGCIADTVLFMHDGGNNVNTWNWDFQNSNSNIQQPAILYTTDGIQTATLIVSNGVCSDTSKQNFSLKPKLAVDFTSPDVGCAGEPVLFSGKTKNATDWFWDFSNGSTSSLENPAPQLYPASSIDKSYTVSLTAKNAICSFTQPKIILIKSNCMIAVPSAFTPNEDGLNDLFGPVNAFLTKDLSFTIFNRYGQVVFSSTISNTGWNGRFRGILQPPGEYTWILSYTNKITGINVSRKGTVTLIR